MSRVKPAAEAKEGFAVEYCGSINDRQAEDPVEKKSVVEMEAGEPLPRPPRSGAGKSRGYSTTVRQRKANIPFGATKDEAERASRHPAMSQTRCR